MADENPEEKKDEDEELQEEEIDEAKEDEEDVEEEQEAAEEEQSEKHVSTDGESLRSDFCQPVSAYEEEEEEEHAEEAWVCEEYQKKEEYFGEEEHYDEYPPELEEEEEEEEEYTPEEKQTLESEYLKSVLGTPLTFALLELATKRPTDPIQFLGHYLLKWRWNGENKARYEEQMKGLNAERAVLLAKKKERERQEMLEKEEKEETGRRAERVESSVEEGDVGEGRELRAEGEG